MDLSCSLGHTHSSEIITEKKKINVQVWKSPGVLRTGTHVDEVSQGVCLHARTLLLHQSCHPALWIML